VFAVALCLLALLELSRHPIGILAAVEHSPNSDRIVLKLVVDREGKSGAQESIKTVNFSVNAAMQNQRIYIREEAVEEVVSDTGALSLVKSEACQQIPICRPRDRDLHRARRRSDFLATSQSMNSSLPATTRASVA
jgi:hypothetical protein